MAVNTSQERKRPHASGGASCAKRYAAFCADKITFIDYKDIRRLRNLVTERGKIIPRRISGNCAGCISASSRWRSSVRAISP